MNEKSMLQLRIDTNGLITTIYSDDLVPLLNEGTSTINRASHVEPLDSKWVTDLSPVNGPLLGPFITRKEALSSEVEWLNKNIIQK